MSDLSPTLEKLAQEIDDLYEAPSRIRPLRRILEREFGASRSVAEVVKEIRKVFPMADQGRGYEALMTQSVESILSRFLGNTESERRKLMGQLHEIDVSIEGYVDGAPDCSVVSALCNCIQSIIHEEEFKDTQYGFVPDKDLWTLGPEMPACEIVPGGINVSWRTLVLHIQKLSNENATFANRYAWLRDRAFLQSPDCRAEFAKLADVNGEEFDAAIDAAMQPSAQSAEETKP